MNEILGVITQKRAEKLLCEWANNFQGKEYMDRLIANYPEVFDRIPGSLNVVVLGDRLRAAWETTDLRAREWRLFQLRLAYWQATVTASSIGTEVSEHNRRMQDVPEVNAFEAMVFHFGRISDRARRCQNPVCAKPYFLAVKRAQKYCSAACALPAIRASNREWWRRNRGKGT